MRRQYEFIKKRKNDEAFLQEMVCRWLDSKGILYIASLMGVNLGVRVGSIRKRMGCRAGTPDLLILKPAGKYHGMTLELKVKGGHITDEQNSFANLAKDNGYYAVIMPPKFEPMEALDWVKKEVEFYLQSIQEEKWVIQK